MNSNFKVTVILFVKRSPFLLLVLIEFEYSTVTEGNDHYCKLEKLTLISFVTYDNLIKSVRSVLIGFRRTLLQQEGLLRVPALSLLTKPTISFLLV